MYKDMWVNEMNDKHQIQDREERENNQIRVWYTGSLNCIYDDSCVKVDTECKGMHYNIL